MAEENMRKKLRWRIALAVGIFLCFLAIFAGLVFSYIQKFDRALIEENNAHLSELADHVAFNMTSIVRATQSSLQTAADAAVVMDTDQARVAYLQGIEEQYSFAYVGYAGADGMLHATVDSQSGYIGGEQYFRDAIVGKSSVTDITRKIFKDKVVTGILFAAPMGEGSEAGVMVAMLDINVIGNVLGIESFGGSGYSYIVDKRGDLVLRTRSLDFNNFYKSLKNVSFEEGYSLNRFLDDAAMQREGMMIYSNLGVDKYAYYRPLGLNSWTLVNIVPKDVIAAKAMMLTKELALIGTGMILLFMALVAITLAFYNISQQRKQAADAKSAFLANMSHEIRTPMNVIVGASEILLRENLTPKQQEAVVSIVNSGKGLLTILNDILDISKMEAGKYSMINEPYELESLLYDLTTVAVIRIGDRPVEFLTEPSLELPRCLFGDMGRVKQMLLNIVGNSVKFTPQGSIRLIIGCTRENDEILLRLEVKDTGIGIKEEDMERLFVSFNQVDTRRNRNVEGTGLGLAITKKLCEMMGGNIAVESQYGQGSSFIMTIRQGVIDAAPLFSAVSESIRLLVCEPSALLRTYEASCMDKLGVVYEFCGTQEAFIAGLKMGGYTHALAGRAVLQAVADDNMNFGDVRLIRLLGLKEHMFMEPGGANVYLPLFVSQLSLILRGSAADFQSPKCIGVGLSVIEPMPWVRILIVDDNEVNLQVAMGLMEPYCMKMDCALSGYEAVESMQKKDYDLVLMDHMMPGMDGVETLQKIRELPDEKYKQLPIVALTANATSEARRLFASAGFDGFLAKPVETAKLHEVLRKWLKNINAGRAAEHPEYVFDAASEKTEFPEWLQAMAAASVDFHKGISNLGSLAAYVGIVRTYLKTTEPRLKALDYLAETDMERFVIEIHGLKSASAAVAAFGLAELAAALEQQGKKKNSGAIKAGLPQFLQRSAKAVAEMEAFLQRADDVVTEVKPAGVIVLTEAVLDELSAAFMNYDTEKLQTLLGSSVDLVGGAAEKHLLEQLRQHYEAYEFELPLRIIAEYKETLRKG